MFDRDTSSYRLALTLGMLVLSGWAVAEENRSPACLVPSLERLAATSPAVRAGLNAAFVKLLETNSLDRRADLAVECGGDYLAAVTLKLEPGATGTVTLVTGSELVVVDTETSKAGTAPDGHSGSWQISLRTKYVSADGRLLAIQPTSDQTESARLIEVIVTAGRNNRPGQRHFFELRSPALLVENRPSPSVLLTVESLESEQMFRDNFRVDPNVGQFSQKRDRPINTDSLGLAAGAATRP